MWLCLQCFNPRPALMPGESNAPASSAVTLACFNPRPALMPGESVKVDNRTSVGRVSIHARH